MKAQLNRALLTQKTYDSGAIGASESVVHQFSRLGRYLGQVRRNGAATGNFSFVVAEEGEIQLDVDLSSPSSGSKAKEADCGCHHGDSGQAVAPKGYVLFHASRGSGYAVRVGHADDEKAEFDSEQLTDGDLFALCLLEPIHYTVADRIGGGKGEIDVSFSEKDAKRLKDLATSYVEVGPKGFEPARLQVVSTQGIVFRVKGKARVVIEKTGETRASESGKPATDSKKKGRSGTDGRQRG